MLVAIYVGSFDPPTMGHLDIARRAAGLFDRLYFAIFQSGGAKHPLFTAVERAAMAAEALHDVPNIVVDTYTGLTVDYARKVGARAIVRGLRAVSDFEYEFTLAHMNERLAPGVESLFLMTTPEYAFVSSSLIKEVAAQGGDVSGIVPPVVEHALRERFGVRS